MYAGRPKKQFNKNTVEEANSMEQLAERKDPYLGMRKEASRKIRRKEETYRPKEGVSCHGDFRKILLKSVDEGLSSLGDSPKQAIYHHLEHSCNIKKTDIPEKIEEFTLAIERIFGDGAKLLEIQIMKRLHKQMGCVFKDLNTDKGELLFAEYLRACETEQKVRRTPI